MWLRLAWLAVALADSGADTATDPEQDDDGDRFSLADGDCDDNDAEVYPGRDEACDGVDNDCDLRVDEDCPEAPAGEGCDCGSRGAAWLLVLPLLGLRRR